MENIKEILLAHPPVFHREADGGYWVEIPDFPGCVSEGDTLAEARANIAEAAELWLETALETGLPITAGSRELVH